jgi:O-acetyl-ADP-ribose deacetylase (regulator of RNase III)
MNCVKGDATLPIEGGNRIIIHICNDVGKWGKGFVMALSKRWPELRDAYLRDPKTLGSFHIYKLEENIFVANLIAQHDIYTKNGLPPIRYDALQKCLTDLNEFVIHNIPSPSIHAPRLGCGLAGGQWSLIEPILLQSLTCPIYIYDL